jgi:hypothetical protein
MVDPGAIQLLENIMSSDKATRENAEKMLAQAKANTPTECITLLVGVVVSPQCSDAVRVQAAVLLRSEIIVHAQDPAEAWLKMSVENQKKCSNALADRYSVETIGIIRRKIGQAITTLAWHRRADKDETGETISTQWPEFFPCIFRAAVSDDVERRADALTAISDVAEWAAKSMVRHGNDLCVLLERAFQQSSSRVYVGAIRLLCTLGEQLDGESKNNKDKAPDIEALVMKLRMLTPMIFKVLPNILLNAAEGYTVIIAISSCASASPIFFESVLEQCVNSFGQIVISGDDDDMRRMALDGLLTVVESKPEWCVKHEKLLSVALDSCLKMLTELDDSNSEDWAKQICDEAYDEDEELYEAGENGLDRLGRAVGEDVLLQPMVQKLTVMLGQPQWQCKMAAVMCVSQTIDVMTDYEHLDEFLKMCCGLLGHEHPRVRHAATHSIYQFYTDHSEHMQERWTNELLPALCKVCNDPVPRVRQRALWTLETLFDLDPEPEYVKDHFQLLTETLAQCLSPLDGSAPPLTQMIYAVGCFGSLAKVLSTEFAPFYRQVMDLLNIVDAKRQEMAQNPEYSSDPEKRTEMQRCEGRVIHCKSRLAVAVGREAARKDLEGLMAQVLQQAQSIGSQDDARMEYFHLTVRNVVRVMKEEFKPLLQPVFFICKKQLELRFDFIDLSQGDDWSKIEDGTISFVGEAGMCARTADLETAESACKVLHTIVDQMGPAAIDAVPEIAREVKPLFKHASVSLEVVFNLWACFLVCCRKTADAGAGQQVAPLFKELLLDFVQEQLKNLPKIVEDGDWESASSVAKGIKTALQGAGKNALAVGQVKVLSEGTLKKNF